VTSSSQPTFAPSSSTDVHTKLIPRRAKILCISIFKYNALFCLSIPRVSKLQLRSWFKVLCGTIHKVEADDLASLLVILHVISIWRYGKEERGSSLKIPDTYQTSPTFMVPTSHLPPLADKADRIRRRGCQARIRSPGSVFRPC
jgi:hypothetical protein